jgi:hypothetical protein
LGLIKGPLSQLRVGWPNHLDRHGALQAAVPSQEDLAHAAAAKFALQGKTALEDHAGRKGNSYIERRISLWGECCCAQRLLLWNQTCIGWWGTEISHRRIGRLVRDGGRGIGCSKDLADQLQGFWKTPLVFLGQVALAIPLSILEFQPQELAQQRPACRLWCLKQIGLDLRRPTRLPRGLEGVANPVHLLA